MANTSVDVDAEGLKRARELTGSKSNREAVSAALKTLIAVRSQPDAVEQIIARKFDDDQIDAPTIDYPLSNRKATPSGDGATDTAT